MTLAEYCGRWLAVRTGRLAPNSIRAYASALRHHVLPALGALELEEITQPVVRGWIADQLLRQRPVNSIKSAIGTLSTILTDALIDGLVLHNAAHGAARRLLADNRIQTPKAMTPHELDAFLLAARTLGSHWASDAFYVYSRTGLRLGELLALQKRSILANEEALRVDQQYHGGKFGFGPPKGGKARLVEVPRKCLAVLLGRAAQLETAGTFLFPGATLHLPIHPGTVEWAFDQAAGIAQLPEHFTVHSLRHTYASILIASGAPPAWVQQQLGHANYQITVDLYGSWLRQRRPDLLAVLDQEPARHGIARVERAKVIPLRQRR